LYRYTMLAEGIGDDEGAWLRRLKRLFRRVCLGRDVVKGDDGDGDSVGGGGGGGRVGLSGSDTDDDDPTGATKDASGLVQSHGERLHLRDTLHPSPCGAAEQIVLTLRLCRAAVVGAPVQLLNPVDP
jgi:hypothetical protein